MRLRETKVVDSHKTHKDDDVTVKLVEEKFSDGSFGYQIELKSHQAGASYDKGLCITIECLDYTAALLLYNTITKEGLAIYSN